jgi:threonine dehydrogenase-like Zn-dependent dehydrogenase
MKALCWHGTGDVRIDTVPDPKIIESRDAIVKVSATAICGSEPFCTWIWVTRSIP